MTEKGQSITIRKPDDWHVHLRDGAMLKAILPFTARRFGRAMVMPNLSPRPAVTDDVSAYRKRIDAVAHDFPRFTPLMTYYLTEQSSPEDIARGFADKIAAAVKLYPANATTNSADGIADVTRAYRVLEKMQSIGMPLLLHGETVMKDGAEIPPMDREKVFLDTTLPKLLKDFPSLKVVLEHATSKDAVDFVLSEASARLASTITAHHLMVTHEDAIGAKKPAYLHCLPIIKSERDRAALRRAATSGSPHFFLGTDSAPHPVSSKEGAKPPGGIFTGPSAIELYAQVFEEEGKLENLEAFASLNGAKFYNLPPNEEKIILEKNPWTIDELVQVGNGDTIRPFGYDEDPAKRLTIPWRLS